MATKNPKFHRKAPIASEPAWRKVSISIPQTVYDHGLEKAKADRRSFSNYVAKLLEMDADGGAASRVA